MRRRDPGSGSEPASRSGGRFAARGEYRFGVVLILLLATFVFLMVGTTSEWARPVTVALTGATLVAALAAAEVSPHLRRLAAVLTVIAVAIALATSAFSGSELDGWAALLSAALIVCAPIAIARSVIRRRVIDAQTVVAALCIYVLAAMLWAFVYNAIGDLGSSSFFSQNTSATTADYMYFSFITQTTTGYGDLTAAGNLGRACAVLEVLIGQIYLVTIIAVLVSRLTPRNRNHR
jgi:hypothetical protein